MGPDIFLLNQPTGPEWERRFSVLGRGLFVATHFETQVWAVAFHVGARRDADAVFNASEDWEQSLELLVRKLHERQLGAHLKSLRSALPLSENVNEILDRARRSRNELIHEAARGFEWRPLEPEMATDLWTRVSSCIRDIAQGDLVLCILESVFNGDPLPSAETLRSYAESLVSWVMGDISRASENESQVAPN